MSILLVGEFGGLVIWRFVIRDEPVRRPASRLPNRQLANCDVLQRRDHVDLDERVSRNPAGSGDGRPHWRFRTEAALEHLVHAGIVLQVVEIDVALQDLLHRRPDALELLLDLIEDRLGVYLDIAFGVVADAGNEYEVPVRDGP